MSTPRPQPVDPPVPAAPHGSPTVDDAPPGPVRARLAYLHAPPPRYPTAARRAHVQGTVILRVQIDASGRPTQVRIEQSSGHPRLDRAARLQVLRKWMFQPARVHGRATPAWALVPVQFRLRG
jgi:protein TonB